MDKIAKVLQKFSAKERERIKTVLEKLMAVELKGLDIKKLKDRDDVFRLRTGDLRIIYRKNFHGNISVLVISRRNEKTYKI